MKLKSLLASRTLERVVLYFLLNPDAAPHFRALQRHLGAGMRPLQQALERLEEHALLRRERQGNRAVYRVDEEHRGWDALRHLLRALADPADVVAEALAGVGGLDAAFVFGSVARGEATEESDVDVLLLGDEIPRREVGRRLLEASVLLGREVNALRYTRREFAEEIARGESFVFRVARGPKRWITGDERSLGRAA